MFTHYDALHITEDASPEVIRAAYRALAQKWHPDKYAGSTENAELRFKAIGAAYEILSDVDARASYDAELIRDRNKQRNDESLNNTEMRESRDSSITQLWAGKVILWKLIWLYMIGIPLSICLLATAYGKDSDSANYLTALMIFLYQVFIHICFWKSANNTIAKWPRRLAKCYCLSIGGAPFVIAAGIYIDRYYSEWQSARFAIEDKPWLSAPLVNPPPAQSVAQAEASGDIADKADFDREVRAAYAKYPFLNSSSAQANPEAISEVVSAVKIYLGAGYSNAESMRKAVSGIAQKYVRK